MIVWKKDEKIFDKELFDSKDGAKKTSQYYNRWLKELTKVLPAELRIITKKKK